MFGKRLRSIRLKRGFTQQSIADKILISLRTYQKYEQGTRFPSYEVLIDLADNLNVSIDWLLGRDDFLESLGVSFDEYL